jgi:hypothetical protein
VSAKASASQAGEAVQTRVHKPARRRRRQSIHTCSTCNLNRELERYSLPQHTRRTKPRSLLASTLWFILQQLLTFCTRPSSTIRSTKTKMTRTSYTPTADPEIQQIIDRINHNWALEDIHDAIPKHLAPRNGPSRFHLQRPKEQTNWTRDLLEHLLDLSEVTKDQHEEVLQRLGKHIEFRRSPDAKSLPLSKGPWVLVADLLWATEK